MIFCQITIFHSPSTTQALLCRFGSFKPKRQNALDRTRRRQFKRHGIWRWHKKDKDWRLKSSRSTKLSLPSVLLMNACVHNLLAENASLKGPILPVGRVTSRPRLHFPIGRDYLKLRFLKNFTKVFNMTPRLSRGMTTVLRSQKKTKNKKKFG